MDTVRDEDEPTANNQDGRDSSPSRKEKNSRRGSSTSASPERRVLKEKDMNRDRERDKERGGKSRKGVVTKRRQTDDYGASDGDDEAEQEIVPVQQYGTPANHFSFHIPAPTQFQHVDMPSVLSRYIQTGFYLSIVIGALYLFIKLVWAIQRDVEDKITEYSSEILHEISLCSKLYLINRCNPETRVPALTATCEEWERCMNRDPRVVGRGRVFIETIAEMYNTFFEGIGYKAFAFSIIGGGVFLWSANAGFSFFRSRHSSSVPMMPSPSYPDMVHPHAHLLQPPPSAGGRAQSPMVSMLQTPGQWREGSPAVGLEWVRARNGDAGGFAQPTTSSRRR
ncbi:hypothetical protein FRC02_002394 [Tulasnella sp. 418]|nr:hypothetical protein FRC02_002394 [Tulasnella sp. 418]